ncbi:MAG: TIGR03000 domain-containing protein [Bacteroidales bacterium]|nr:TIGR03000 domain-containing protein [Bacteroidales bacterium]
MRGIAGVGLCVLSVTLSLSPLAAQAPTATAQTKLVIKVPEPDSELYIEGRPTKTTGVNREFETPNLEAGKTYEYDFKVSWRPNNYTVLTRTRSVQFQAGDSITVDLTKDVGTEKAIIRYVPTPNDIVDKMIALAKLKKDDVTFELGCGDARISVAAVKAGAKKAVGIDLDPERIEEAKATVKAAGVTDRVEIRKGDALDVKDLSEASVVFLYMGNEFNALVRPTLWKQLQPGSRVVSHRFTMGDWKPDQTIKVTGEDGDQYELHIWTVTDAVKKMGK